MFIDPHVHCRDWEQAYKETIEHTLHVAEKAGFTAILDMPNTKPPVTTKERVLERLAIAKRANSPVLYGTHMMLTSSPEQIKRAVQAYRDLEYDFGSDFRYLSGFKYYAAHSVGTIKVSKQDQQQRIFKTLAEEGYDGVLVVHCEKESCMHPALWNPEKPITHALARPAESELHSLEDQISYAKEYHFKGTLHIAHISVPEAVRKINSEKNLKITCGVTPHHCLLDLEALEKPEGIMMKINPPLRSPSMKKEMIELLKQGMITWIETDHAPHTLNEKIRPPYLSGITGLQKYPKFIHWLTTQGLNHEHIKKITFEAIALTYGFNIQPRTCIPYKNLEHEYLFDPYEHFGVL